MERLRGAASDIGREPLLTVPNVLSGLRLLSVPVFLWLFVTGRETAAVILFAIGASSDFFDGYIARATGSVTELGKLLDPIADRVLIVALAVALVVRDALPWGLATAIVARDVLIAVAFALLARRGVPRIDVNNVGKGATACLLLGLTWLAASFVWSSLGREIGLALVWIGAVLYWVAGALYAREARSGLRALGAQEER